MTGQTPHTQQDGWDGGGCPAGGFGRRSFLQGAAATGFAATAAGNRSPLTGRRQEGAPAFAGEPQTGAAVPFYGEHQAGIISPPPDQRQAVGNFAAFDVAAANRGELTDLFRTLTAQAAFLTAGGRAPTASPGSPQPDDGVMGPQVPADALTVTVGVGASLFDGRYGLGARKPVQLVTMTPFRHDDLDPALSSGDLLIQLCAASRDTAVHLVSARTGTITATVPTGQGPFGVTLAPSGRAAYAAILGPGNVSAISTQTHRIWGTVNVGPPQTDPFNIAVTSSAVYVTDQGAGTLTVIDPKALKVVATVTVGNSPYGVAVDP